MGKGKQKTAATKSGCYPTDDLRMFEKIITQKLREAREGLKALEEENVPEGKNGTSDTSPVFKCDSEEGANVLSKEKNAILISQKSNLIADLEKSLLRIKNGTYGICRITGKKIPKERLLAIPHAATTTEGQMLEEKGKPSFFIQKNLQKKKP